MRLRQYLANRYTSSESINAEFENVIRYLNAAELGNLTLSELLLKIFDEDGGVVFGVSFRYNPATGIEVKTDPDSDEWQLLVTVDDIRGPAGESVGSIEGPLFFNRQDVTATSGQTIFAYTIVSEAADVLVWRNGVLQGSATYTYNRSTNQVTLASGVTAGDLITLTSIRTNPATAYRRTDMTAAAGQVTFPFPFSETEELAVFRNGIFQREGGGYDFIKNATTDTITMTVPQSSGTLITVMCITNAAVRDVAGIMLEDRYTDGGGMIRLDRVSIPDGSLPQARVSGLVTALALRPKLTYGPTAPASPSPGDFWCNTSTAVPSMNFYDGARWLNVSPNGLVPIPLAANALQYLRLNSTATGLEYASIDLSGVIPTSSRGAANGVAPLDAGGLLPAGVIPQWAARSPIIGGIKGSITNGTYYVGVIEDLHQFDGLTASLSAGSATLQLQVAGSSVGSSLAVTTTPTRLAITPTTKDATSTPMNVTLVVSGASAASDLSFNIGGMIVG